MTDHATLAERLGPVIPTDRWLASPDVTTVRAIVDTQPDAEELVDALGLNGRAMATYSAKVYERGRRARKKAER